MSCALIRLSIITLAVCALSTGASAQAVALGLSSQSTTYCPSATNVPVGDVAVTAGNNGSIPGGAVIQVFFPAPLTSTPILTMSPAVAGVTVESAGSVTNIRFASTQAVTTGTRFQLSGIRLNVSQLPMNAAGVSTAEVGGIPQSAFTFSNISARVGSPDTGLCPVTVILSKTVSTFRVQVATSLSVGDQVRVASQDGNNFALPTLNVATDDGGSWISNASVTIEGQNNLYTINILPVTAALPIGKYTGKITVLTPNSTNTAAVEIIVNLTIFSDQPISVSQTSMVFRTTIGVDPPPQTFTATVVPPVAPPTVTAQTSTPVGGNWLNVTSTTSGNTVTITVSPKAAGLAATPLTLPYSGLITLTSELASQATQNIIVQLQVDSQAAVLSLTQTKMDFTAAAGSSTATSLNAVVGNTGGGTLAFTAAAATDRGGNWLTATPASGTAPGNLTVTANPAGLATGYYTGRVTITATGATNSPMQIAVTLTVGTVPRVAERGIKQGASFSDGTATAGTILSLFGSNLATATQSAQSLPLPTLMAGAQVKVNGNAAPLFYVSPTQINFQLPTEVTGASVTITPSLNSLDGPPVTVPLVASVPGLFSLTSDGAGPGAILKPDFTVVSSSNPAARGSVVLIYGTGFGATAPTVPSGQPAPGDPPGLAKLVATPSVSIGGQSAQILFAGFAPGFVGLFQINAVVPATVTAGNAPVVVTIGSATSNTVTMAVQ